MHSKSGKFTKTWWFWESSRNGRVILSGTAKVCERQGAWNLVGGWWKWNFGLAERESLDCVLMKVPPSRNRKTLIIMPIINQHCKEGSKFCSVLMDGRHIVITNWRSTLISQFYVLHSPVNHTKNYVDPETGAHTQAIEGLWAQGARETLPSLSWHEATRFVFISSKDGLCGQDTVSKEI